MIVKMEDSIKDDYGIDTDSSYNRFLTYQWDKAQKEVSRVINL